MQGINQVVLSGNLTETPELEYSENGKAYTMFTLAVNSFGGDDDDANFINIQVWGTQAENVAQYLEKGSGAEIVGRLDVSSYEEDGEYKDFTRVVANRVNFLTLENNGGREEDLPDLDESAPTTDLDEDEEEIPF